MLLIAAVALCVLLLPLTGGSLVRLATIRLRVAWLVAAALALQIVTISILPHGSHIVHAAAHLFSYALIIPFLWANRSTSGFALLSVGTVMNFTAIAANGGTMPASAAALRVAGIPSNAAETFRNSTVIPHARLSFLGDIFAVPAYVPLHNVFSIGDILIVLGVCQTILTVGGSRLLRTHAATTASTATVIGLSKSEIAGVTTQCPSEVSEPQPVGGAGRRSRHVIRKGWPSDRSSGPADALSGPSTTAEF